MSRNVLYINSTSYIGGAEKSLLTLMANLDAERYRAELVTTAAGELALQARRTGIPVHLQEFAWFSKRRPWRYPSSILRLTQTTRESNASIVHTNCDRSLPYAWRASRLGGAHFVAHIRDFVRRWFDGERLTALQHADRVIANSRAIAEACIAAGIGQDRIEVIYNPVDLSLFDGDNQREIKRVRTELGLPARGLVIGLVGQIQPIKGHLEFVTAAKQLRAHVPNAKYVIVGKASTDDQIAFEAQLRQFVHQNDLDSDVLFTGYRQDIEVIMKLFDILVVPSWREPFGRVVVEGLAAGCTVIASNTGGIPEILEQEKTGILIEPRNPYGIVEAVLEVARDPELKQRLRESGLERARSFDVEHHVKKIEALYDRLSSSGSMS